MLELEFLNQFKKNNKEQRRLQNKRYREKHHEIINLKNNFTIINKHMNQNLYHLIN